MLHVSKWKRQKRPVSITWRWKDDYDKVKRGPFDMYERFWFHRRSHVIYIKEFDMVPSGRAQAAACNEIFQAVNNKYTNSQRQLSERMEEKLKLNFNHFADRAFTLERFVCEWVWITFSPLFMKLSINIYFFIRKRRMEDNKVKENYVSKKVIFSLRKYRKTRVKVDEKN
jgi:hypothetical protein